MTGPKFEHAGSADPAPLAVASSSDVEPLGSAGLVNQGSVGTVAEVAPVYGNLAESTRDAAMSKRDADDSALNG